MIQAEQPSREQLLLTIARLQQEVEALQQDKADLEIVLETTTAHSDVVEAELQDQAEEAVRESGRRVAQFLEAVPVGVFVVDAAGKPYYANQTAQQLLGQGIAPDATAEQLAQVYQVYTAGTDRLYPNTQLPLVQALRGESATVDDMEIHQGDRIIALETWATPIFNEKGEIIYAISAFQDITARKQAEVAFQEREKQYREIFEATSDGLIINTLDGKVAEANPAACNMHGYSHQEFVDLDPKTFIHPDYHPLFTEYVQTFQPQIQFEAQALDLRKDGTAFPVEIRGTTFTYKGKPHILAVVRDITERQQAEAQLRLSAQRDRLLGEIALRIRQSLDLEQILNTTVTEVRQFLGCDRVGICYIDKNWQTKSLAESVAPGWRSLLGITLGDATFSRNMLAYYQQGVQAVDDISQVELHSANSANIEILQQYQIRAYLGAPIMLDASHTEAYPVLPGLEHSEKYFNDQGFWLLVAHQCSGTRTWQPFEIDLLEQLGTQVAFAIQQAKLYQQLAALNANNEASLRASEERLRTLINATPDIICFKDGDGCWLESNQANLEFLELEGVDYRGKTDSQLAEFSNFYREALINCYQTDEQAWQLGAIHRVEEIIPRPDGTVSITDMIKVPLFDQQKRRKGLVVLGRDISDLKQVEEALRASEAQYRDLVQTANCIILRWGTDGTIRFMNTYGQRLFGFELGEILNQNVAGTIVPATETSGRDLPALMVDICQHPENYLFNENENICKNGERLWIVWANKPILDPQGNLVEILSVGTDATKRKRAEAALEASETKFRTIVENANDILFVINPEGVFTYLSPNLLYVTGYQPAELEGNPFVSLIYPDDLPACLAAVRQVVVTGQRQSEIEYRIKYKDGNYHWQVSNLAPSQDGDGNLLIIGVARDITERKQVEETLRRSELKYRNIFENSQVGIGRTRLVDGLVLDANQRFAEIMGYGSATDLIHQRCSTEFYAIPEDRQQVLVDVRREGEVHNLELPLRQPDGSVKWGLLSLRLNEAEECLDFVMTDISERKRLETERNHREEALRLIVEGTAAKTGDEFFLSCVRYLAEVLQVKYAIVTRFVDEAKTRVSTLAVWGEGSMGKNFEYDLQGVPCGEVLQGKTCYYPKDLQSRFPTICEFAALRAESYLGIPLVDSSSNILGSLAVMDVKPMEPNPGRELILKIFAARAGAELERKQADEALQRRAQVDSLLSSISRQFIDQDVDTAINFTLRAIAELMGTERCYIFEYSSDQSQVWITHEWCYPGVPPLPSASRGGPIAMFPWFNSQLLNGQMIHLSTLAEFPPEAAAERAAFERHLAQSLVTVPTIHSGKVVGFLSVDVVNFSRTWSQADISLLKLVGELIAIGIARHKAEEALRVAKEVAVGEAARSADANRAKSTFLANMSHELRTPLNAILGFSQLMERDNGLTPRQQESLAIINRSGEHLLNLINDVLEMSKIEAGRITLNPAPFDLRRLLETLEEMFQIRVKAKQLSLQFEIAPELPHYVLADEGKLRQILINLLSNAVKFTDQGGVTLRARAQESSAKRSQHSGLNSGLESTQNALAVACSGDPALNERELVKTHNSCTLHFEVEDTGRGIAPEEIDSLFQPFVQTTSATQVREGTGLGLTISRQFVQLMGGDIDLTSKVAQGSTFRFQVPVTPAEPPEEVAQPITKGLVVRIAPHQPVYRVLVVDDRLENRQLIEQLLQTVGFETQAANDGQAAIAQWQSWQPHLVWMDMRMPVMDGYEAARQIRILEQQAFGQRTVIIALTASAFEEQRANILAAGCDDLVRKPFREQVIFDKLTEHLGVQFIYEKQERGENLAPSRSPLAGQPPWQNITSSNLTVMPAEWTTTLHQAATRVNAKLIAELLAQIPEEHIPLAQALQDLVDRYRFDIIVDLTQSNCN